MARPTTWLDIPEYERRGGEIIRWDAYKTMGHPALAKHLVAAAEAAKKLGLTTTSDGIYETLTSEQLEVNLLKAQEAWDLLKNNYEVAVDYPVKTPDLWQINNWAVANGRPKIVVPE